MVMRSLLETEEDIKEFMEGIRKGIAERKQMSWCERRGKDTVLPPSHQTYQKINKKHE